MTQTPRHRWIIVIGFVAALWPWSSGTCANAAPTTAKTNFVLVMADDMGWGDVAANGSNKIVHTPNLDAMAAAGLRLTRCYATSPQCTPTRAGFLTGRHPSRNACYCAGGNPLPTEATTMAELLRDAGYATGHFGKWHVGGVSTKDPTGPSRQGFDSQYSIINSYMVHKMDVSFTPTAGRKAERSSGYCEDVVMDAALEFVRASVEEERPFLAVVWNLAPHSPFLATEADRRPYADLPEDEQHFWGQITNIDKNVGRLRRELRTLGVAENTLLVFTSDNGAVFRSRDHDPFQGGKNNLWEGGLRVPGLIEWPARITEPRVSDVPVNLVDLFPTVLELAGVAVPQNIGQLDGVSLVPLLDGKWKERPQPMGFHFLHQRWEGNLQRRRDEFLSSVGKVGFAVIDNRYKLITNLRGEAAQLYDVVDDPAETNDLACTHPEIVSRLQNWRKRWWASVVGDQRNLGIEIDPDTLQPRPPE
jgi:arylsulfatase A-like enzyme